MGVLKLPKPAAAGATGRRARVWMAREGGMRQIAPGRGVLCIGISSFTPLYVLQIGLASCIAPNTRVLNTRIVRSMKLADGPRMSSLSTL
jgi:hypothetical protein